MKMIKRPILFRVPVKKQLSSLINAGEVIEVRIIGTPEGVVSGYYDNLDKLEGDLYRYNGNYNVFFTMNKLNDSVDSVNRNVLSSYSINTTKDKDISKRRYVLIDVDPERPTGCSSTDDEHEYSLKKAMTIESDLRKFGFGPMITCDSGNGYHLLIPVDMENTKEVTKLVHDFLKKLSIKYNDAVAKVDITTYNAARIIKLYGTKAVKGNHTEERPHRVSGIVTDMTTFERQITPIEIFEKYVSNDTKYEKKHSKKPKVEKASTFAKFDVQTWVESHGYQVNKIKDYNEDSTLFEIVPCPFENGHDEDNGAFIIQSKDGYLSAGCHHNKCAGENWDTLWKKLEPNLPNPNERFHKKSEPKKKETYADIIMRIIDEEKHYFFKNQYGEIYVEVPQLGNQVFKVMGNDYRGYLLSLYYEKMNTPIREDNVKDVLKTLNSFYKYNTEDVVNTYKRLGHDEDKNYYYYLNDEQKNCVILQQENGYYDYTVTNVLDKCKFIASNEMRTQVSPSVKDDGMEFLDYMKKYYIQLSDYELLLHNVLICYRVLHGMVQPLCFYVGAQGSGKSTLASLDCEIINPMVNSLTSRPTTIKDWQAVLSKSDYITFDNISHLSQAESDLLCVAVDANATSTQRKLYTDDETNVLNIYTSINFTSIYLVANQRDLASRGIMLRTGNLDYDSRKDIIKIKEEFRKDLPNILSKMFKILVDALNMEKQDKIDNEKMYIRNTSFQRYGRCIAKAMGYTEGEFYDALKKNESEMNLMLDDMDDFTSIVIEFMQEKKDVFGTPSNVFAEIKKFHADYPGLGSINGLTTPATFSKELSKKADALRLRGVTYSRGERNGKRYLKFEYKQ